MITYYFILQAIMFFAFHLLFITNHKSVVWTNMQLQASNFSGLHLGQVAPQFYCYNC